MVPSDGIPVKEVLAAHDPTLVEDFQVWDGRADAALDRLTKKGIPAELVREGNRVKLRVVKPGNLIDAEAALRQFGDGSFGR